MGLPYLPVTEDDVAPAVERLRASLDGIRRLLFATVDGQLAAWLVMTGNTWRLTAHRASLTRAQTALPLRGRGVGTRLLAEAARSARVDLDLDLDLDHACGSTCAAGRVSRRSPRAAATSGSAPGDGR